MRQTLAGVSAFVLSAVLLVGMAWGKSPKPSQPKVEVDPNIEIAQGHFRKSQESAAHVDFAGAIAEIDQAIAVWPHPDLYFNKGVYLEQAGQPAKAIEAFKLYRGLIARKSDAKNDLRKVNDRIAALERQTAPLTPTQKREAAKTHFMTGRLHFDAGDYEQALLEFQAARTGYYLAELDLYVARSLEKLGRLNDAVLAYRTYYLSLEERTEPEKVQAQALKAYIKRLKQRAEAAEAGEPMPPASSIDDKPPVSFAEIDWDKPAGTAPLPEEEAEAERKAEAEEEAEEAAAAAAEALAHPPPPPTKPPFFKQYRGPLLVAGGGLLALAVGTGLAVSSKVSYDDLKSTCSPHCTDEQLAGPKTSGYVGAAFLAAGALAVVGGTVWGIVTWKRHRTPTSPSVTFAPTGSGLVVAGTF